MLRVNEIFNSIRWLGENIKDAMVVKKILRSLSSRFDSKLSTIEEVNDLNAFSLDEMYGSLTAYEMRINKSKLSNKETIFKVDKDSKSKEDSDEDI